MIAEDFDTRTIANMEVALERACKMLSIGAEQHAYRRYLASRILERAHRGDTTLGGLTEAGCLAASELRARAKARLTTPDLNALRPSTRRPDIGRQP